MKTILFILTTMLVIPAFGQQTIAFRMETLRQDTVDEPPTILKHVSPIYPQSAKDAKVEGTVWVKVYVDERGKPISVDIMKSPRNDLSEAAKEAAMKFEFTPGKLKSKPVRVWVSVPFNFKLEESEAKLELLEGALNSDQITMALKYLGIDVVPIRYSLPYDHQITFWVDFYQDGKKERTNSSTWARRAGETSMVLILRNDNGKIGSGISYANGSRGFSPVSIGGNKAFLNQTLGDAHIAMNRKLSFYVFAADPHSVSSIRNGDAEAYIKKYPLVLVFSAELKPKDGK